MNLTPEQFKELLTVLTKIADKPFSIAGASDWSMLVALGVVIMATIGFGGKWIIFSISKDISVLAQALVMHKAEDDKDHDRIWASHEDCQRECCPRAGRRAEDRLGIHGRLEPG